MLGCRFYFNRARNSHSCALAESVVRRLCERVGDNFSVSAGANSTTMVTGRALRVATNHSFGLGC